MEFSSTQQHVSHHGIDSLWRSHGDSDHSINVTPSIGNHLTYKQIIARGWTKGMIRSFLGSPDALAENPHFAKGRPMRLYSAAKVDEAEILPAFKEWLDVAAMKRQQANATNALKAEALVGLANSMEFSVPFMSVELLKRKTKQEYGSFFNQPDDAKQQVAYLAQHTKESEWGLDDYFWHPGIRKARQTLRRRVLAAIIDQYPHLADAVLEISKLENGETV